MGGDDASLALLDNRHPDRADMGGGADVYARWGSGMTDWREELIEKMADAMFASYEDWTLRVDVMTRAALAVAEPVIREQCAEMAENYGYAVSTSKYASSVGAMCACGAAKDIAAAIREGGKDD